MDKATQWNSAPVKVCVTLSHPTVSEPLDDNNSLATEILLAATVADVVDIKDKRAIDMMGVAHDYTECVVSTVRGSRRKCTFRLQDDSKATLSVTIWRPGTDSFDFLSLLEKKVVRIFGLSTDFYNGGLQLTAMNDMLILPGGGSEKAQALNKSQDELLSLDGKDFVSVTGAPSISTDGEASLTFALCYTPRAMLKMELRRWCLGNCRFGRQ